MKKNRVVQILVILAFAFLLFGCPTEGNEVAVEKMCSIYGKITAVDIKDMTLYKVKLTDENDWSSPFQSLTDEGDYRFNNLNAGSYWLSIYVPGKYEPVKVALLDLKPGDVKEYNYKVEKSDSLYPDVVPVEPEYRKVNDGAITTSLRGIEVPVSLSSGITEILPLWSVSNRNTVVKAFRSNSLTVDHVLEEFSKEVKDTRIVDAYKGSIEYLLGLTLKLEWPEELRPLVSKLRDLLSHEYLNPSNIVRAEDVVMLQMTESLIMNLAEIGKFTDGKLVSPQTAIESFPKTALIELDEYALVLAYIKGIRKIDCAFHLEFQPVPNAVLLEHDASGAAAFADLAYCSMNEISKMSDEQLMAFWRVLPIYESCYQLFNKYYSNDSSTRWYELYDNHADFRIVMMYLYDFYDSRIMNLVIDKDNIKLLDSFGFDVDRLRTYRVDEIMMAIIEASGANRKEDDVSLYIPAYFFKDGIDLVTVQQKLNDHTDPGTIKLRNILFDRADENNLKAILKMLSELNLSGFDQFQWETLIESFKKTFNQKLI